MIIIIMSRRPENYPRRISCSGNPFFSSISYISCNWPSTNRKISKNNGSSIGMLFGFTKNCEVSGRIDIFSWSLSKLENFLGVFNYKIKGVQFFANFILN